MNSSFNTYGFSILNIFLFLETKKPVCRSGTVFSGIPMHLLVGVICCRRWSCTACCCCCSWLPSGPRIWGCVTRW